MKLLKPWIYLLAASASQALFADDALNDYRLGSYMQAGGMLAASKDKSGAADYYLGRLYLYGYGVLKNNNLALRYFTAAAEKGYLPAQQLIARYALLRENNPEKAAQWFKKAAAQGDMDAKMYMASSYIFGVGVKKNEDTARQYYIDSAKNGNPIAQYTLAKHFLDSRQMANKKLGLIWLNKAVQAGNPAALTKLAQLHLAGQLVAKDPLSAQKLLDQAVSQNYAPAMMQLGKMALEEKDYPKALGWFQKASSHGYQAANLAQANLYLLESTPLHNKDQGFLMMLKSAQAGYIPAEKGLAALYKQGIGVSADANIAQEWEKKAKEDAAKKSGAASAAAWLSGGATKNMAETAYQLRGIFSAWQNTNAVKEQSYNPTPMRAILNRQMLIKPQFTLTQPNEVPISTYYDALVNTAVNDAPRTPVFYPAYPLNPEIVALESANSKILRSHEQILPWNDSYPLVKTQAEPVDLLNFDHQNLEESLNYASVIEALENRAILGDPEAQFDLGQLYQYGIGVAKNEDQAIFLYQNAIDQQQESAEYTLGILYLKRDNPQDRQKGQDILLSAAFKGNEYAQYVLADLLPQTEKDQALAMQYLAAANGYGLAQYALAEYLVREKGADLSVTAQQDRIKRIRSLYASAAKQGIAEASLPLAFYNAMDSNPDLQGEAFKVALQEAQAGDAKAALLAGLLYDRGIGTARDQVKAIYWYQQAKSNPVRDFILGTYTSEGQGIAANLAEGKQLLRHSADSRFAYADLNLAVLAQQAGDAFLPELTDAWQLGNSKAGILLADYYLSADTDAVKMQEAKTIYSGLANKGDQFAQLKLAYMFAEGLGSAVDWQQAAKWYSLAAEQGNSQAQYLLAELYQRGVLGEPDYPAALAWYARAAKTFPDAAVAEGFLYETVFDDYAKAYQCYAQAADAGNALGQYNLALMLELGKGRPEDFTKAGTLYEQAANQGFSPAMTQLAGLYFTGLGKDKNEQQALSWYKKAAEKGNANALYTLGLLSETGIATQIAFNNALSYYQKAADKGNEKAMLALARMYHYGLGIPKNIAEAVKYYEILADKNNAYAQLQLAKQYLAEAADEAAAAKGRKFLEQASENGNQAAAILLLKLDAAKGDKVSYVEPFMLNSGYSIAAQTPNIIYYNALNAWNRGDETLSRLMLNRLIQTWPDYTPGQRAVEQLKA